MYCSIEYYIIIIHINSYVKLVCGFYLNGLKYTVPSMNEYVKLLSFRIGTS